MSCRPGVATRRVSCAPHASVQRCRQEQLAACRSLWVLARASSDAAPEPAPAAPADPLAGYDDPETAQEAIDQGLLLTGAGMCVVCSTTHCTTFSTGSCLRPVDPRCTDFLWALRRWDRALVVFEKALNLPGTGIKRFRCVGGVQKGVFFWLRNGLADAEHELAGSLHCSLWCKPTMSLQW
jgi:hypothetical protein